MQALVFIGHLLTSAPFRVRPPGPVSGQLSGAATRRRWPDAPVSCRLSAHRHSLLEHPVPASLQLPLRSAYQARCLDLDGVSTFHTSEIRPGWAPSIPRSRRCSHDWLIFSGRRLPHFNGLALLPRCHLPPTRGSDSRGIIKGSLTFTRPVFSLPVAPGRIGSPWASSLSFAPRNYPRRTSERRQALSTRPELRIRHSRTSYLRIHSTCATSCRTDHYQVRTYTAWYRHITLSTLAAAFLAATAHAERVRDEKGAPAPIRAI